MFLWFKRNHYWLECLRFLPVRQNTILKLPILLSTKTMLLGSHTLSLEQNLEIFEAVQKFILCSKRFDQVSLLHKGQMWLCGVIDVTKKQGIKH